MKEDPIEIVCERVVAQTKQSKSLIIPEAFLISAYRVLTSNFSGTAYREFVLALKTLNIVSRAGNNLVFNPEAYEEYKKLANKVT